MQINTNIQSLNIFNNLRLAGLAADERMQRLGSGLRINKGADDPSGLPISRGMTAQVRGVNTALANTQDGISMFRVMDGGLDVITDMLQRMRELSVRAANEAPLTQDDRNRLNAEFQSLAAAVEQTAQSTKFNGKQVLVGNGASAGGLTNFIPISNPGFTGSTAGWTPYWNNMTNGAYSWDAGYGQSVHLVDGAGFGETMLMTTLNTPLQAGDIITASYYVPQAAVDPNTHLVITIGDNTPLNMIQEDSYSFPAAAPGWYTLNHVVQMDRPAGYVVMVGSRCNVGPYEWFVDEITFQRQLPPAPPSDPRLQVGPDSMESHNIPVAMPDARAKTIGVDTLDIAVASSAQNAISSLDTAISDINDSRARIGAMERRLINITGDLNAQAINISAANSHIQDADMASEIAGLTRDQILLQSSQKSLQSAIDTHSLIGNLVANVISNS